MTMSDFAYQFYKSEKTIECINCNGEGGKVFEVTRCSSIPGSNLDAEKTVLHCQVCGGTGEVFPDQFDYECE